MQLLYYEKSHHGISIKIIACLMAFYLTYLIAFYLVYVLAFYLAYLLAFYLAYPLAFYLAYFVTSYLAYLLAFYQVLSIWHCIQHKFSSFFILSGMSSDIVPGLLSGRQRF